jgi:enoyl-CoA hydratase
MDYERIIYQPGRVTRIIMNRPRYRNGISHPMYMELEDAFDRATADEECRVIVHSGAGPCFSGGNDPISPEAQMVVYPLRTLAATPGEAITMEQLKEKVGSEEAARAYWESQHNYYSYEMKLKKWRDIPKPTIAMVHGWCVYGAVFSAAAMDIIFASEDATFIFPFGQYDTTVWDFSARKTKEILFEHRAVPAREAYEFGFVNRIFSNPEVLEKETLAYANRVAENEQLTQIRFAKNHINRTLDMQGYGVSVDMANTAYRLMNASFTAAEREDMKQSKGIARIPRAVANLEAKRESEKRKKEEA